MNTINHNHSEPLAELPNSQELAVEQLNRALSLNWSDYHQILNELPAGYQVSACLKLLNSADEQLNQGQDFANSSVVERYLVGGIRDSQVDKNYPFDTQLLGDMHSFASFKKLLRNDPSGLAKLLKIIPTSGPIDGWHFSQFIDGYQTLFADNAVRQAPLFPATRLLTMKRPDQFVALDDTTARLFYLAFAIKPLKKQDFQRYWDEIILPIQKTPWFKAIQPMDPAQLPFYRVRVALLERIVAVPATINLLESDKSTVGIAMTDKLAQKSNHEHSALGSNEIERSDTPTNNNLAAIPPKPQIKKIVKQPKTMTIARKQSAKVNRNAATKLMSQYYFANKEKFSKFNMAKHRESILDRLVDGESVGEIFKEVLSEIV